MATNDGGNSPSGSVVTLLNTGVVGFSPTTPIRFPFQLVGTTSPPQTITLTNRGSNTLSVAFARLVEAAQRLGLADVAVSPRELSAELLRAMEGVGQSRGAARAAAIAIARPLEVAGLSLDLAVVCRASTGPLRA